MATSRDPFDAKLQALKLEIERTFDELDFLLSQKRRNLLGRLAIMKEGRDRNVELEAAMEQLRIVRDTALNVMTSNVLGGELDSVRETFEAKILAKEKLKVAVNLELTEFRCFSGKIHKAMQETDLITLIPEYVGREVPVLKRCSVGVKNGDLKCPRGIAIHRTKNEVYIADDSNSRIQVLTAEGKYIRSFGSDHLKEPHGICVSPGGVFVTDRAWECLMRFTLAGKFINKTGSRGTTPGCFTAISGLCYKDGSVYVCDCNMQRIQVFNIDLQFVKWFGYGEIRLPTDISVYADVLHIISQDDNTIYCYERDGTYLKKIELIGQVQQMTAATFFTIDSRGNFLITDNLINEIRVFSPDGVLKHTLGRGQHNLLTGITLDAANSVICVCHGNANNCFQKY